jgi:glycosyltransferase involved in cell wall biosynthesis
MKIWANTIIQNEERYIWFSIMSVINYVDKVLVWDTGSTDNTVHIVKQIQKDYPNKIIFKEVGEVSVESYPKVRQIMLDETMADWVMILDGDEVWWSDKMAEIADVINNQGDTLETIVCRYKNLIGDIYHYQDPRVGRYEIDGEKGNLSIKFMNMKIPGLKADRPHGQIGYIDSEGTLIQHRDRNKRHHIAGDSFLHFTHLIRSKNIALDLKVPKRSIKYKYELGLEFPLDYYYPESFFLDKPDTVLSPWNVIDNVYKLNAFIQTPLKKFKRKFLLGNKSGY